MNNYNAEAVAHSIASRLWTEHSLDAIDDIFTDDVEYRDIAFKMSFNGKSEVQTYLDSVIGSMPDFKEEIDEVLDIGPGIIVTKWHYGGTYVADAERHNVWLPGVSVIHMRGDKVSLNHDFYSGQAFLDAIGQGHHDVDSFNQLLESAAGQA
ncbi:nuclear transport factor 2 family protein [Rhodococcus koreensis]